MSIMPIRLPDDQHERLRMRAARQGIRLNQCFEAFSTRILLASDPENPAPAGLMQGS